MTSARERHRAFLNSYYGRVKHVYDASRRFFLFGRDEALEALLAEPWQSLIEVGPGTGRNLVLLRGARKDARYGGVEASDEMLALARRRCPWAKLAHGYAEDADYASLLDTPPERILFSYCLSMVQEPARALEHARRSVAPGGEVWVVDFGDMRGMALAARPMQRFLRAFHVLAPDTALFGEPGAEVRWGPGRYYVIARLAHHEARSAPARDTQVS